MRLTRLHAWLLATGLALIAATACLNDYSKFRFTDTSSDAGKASREAPTRGQTSPDAGAR